MMKFLIAMLGRVWWFGRTWRIVRAEMVNRFVSKLNRRRYGEALDLMATGRGFFVIPFDHPDAFAIYCMKRSAAIEAGTWTEENQTDFDNWTMIHKIDRARGTNQ